MSTQDIPAEDLGAMLAVAAGEKKTETRERKTRLHVSQVRKHAVLPVEFGRGQVEYLSKERNRFQPVVFHRAPGADNAKTIRTQDMVNLLASGVVHDLLVSVLADERFAGQALADATPDQLREVADRLHDLADARESA